MLGGVVKKARTLERVELEISQREENCRNLFLLVQREREQDIKNSRRCLDIAVQMQKLATLYGERFELKPKLTKKVWQPPPLRVASAKA